jgi:outer membrane protein OmpA-like peptidoglycan-associated protein
MAEIFILLIFCLLLTLAFGLEKLENENEQLRSAQNGEIRDEVFRLVQEEFPLVRTLADFKKKLSDAFTSARIVRDLQKAGRSVSEEDTRVGAMLRQQALAAGVKPDQLVSNLLDAYKKAGGGPLVDEWPPFMSLSDADGYSFSVGSADLAPGFEADLRGSIAETLVKLIHKHKVTVVEVVGHTDEQKMKGASNLDTYLGASLNGAPSDPLQSSDNAGLGMARAASVVRVLKSDPRFQGVTILPLSAAQVIYPTDQLAAGDIADDEPKRRRIEIRLRKSSREIKGVQ